ncbi:hypothetical protein SAMN05216319_3509 [Duganella sp. CF402]|uniref:hypothetical protein n=1 Tax=unclassified Duganella TaxID=2636909 RepID=UPI0008C5ADA7|nr:MULTISPECIES: hypothetical protein [unclassified Duganella]RZT08083.1 hypothetical protein EV582_0108 [Duganella sp. BK701]SEM06250.1 hypothetical protein SAMN05216319_3509 [Duganella sp. CF402]
MKFSYLSAAAALAVAAALAACGGKAQFTVQGSITGLANSGLVLANGSDQVTVPSGATRFAFGKQIDYGTDYNITVLKNPAHMNCVVSGATGSAGHNVTIESLVTCTQNEYTLGGQFTGLTAAADGTARTVTLVNGTAGGSVVISSANGTAGAGDFVLGATVPDGQAYGVTVLTQPTGLNCTLANGVGVMHEVAVSNLLLTCVPQ